MEPIITIWAPLAIGACWGVWLGRSDRLSWLLTTVSAPVVSGVVVCAAIVVIGVASGKAPANPDNPNSLIMQWLAATCLYALGIFFLGAIPAAVGSLLGQFCKFAAKKLHHRP